MFLAWAAARTSLSRCSSRVSVWRTGCRVQSEWHLLLTLRRLSLYVMDSMMPPGVATVQMGNVERVVVVNRACQYRWGPRLVGWLQGRGQMQK